jgi:hypothetical protein
MAAVLQEVEVKVVDQKGTGHQKGTCHQKS